MAATLTITGTAGAGVTVAAKVFANVTQFTVDTEKSMIYFYQEGAYREISIVAAATVTATKSGTTWTLTIS
jgi:RNase adaptor protein for sRNA GlmZ degradation